MKTESMTDRRNFLKKSGLILGSGVIFTILPSIFTSCEENEQPVSGAGGTVTINIASEQGLQQAGGTIKKVFPGHNGDFPLIIHRISDTKFLTVTSVCTHQGCEVGLPGDFGSDQLECGCHGSVFSKVDGSVIKNPPNASVNPLPKFTNTFDANTNLLTIYF